MDIQESIAARIRSLREQRGLTQRGLAERIGVTTQYVNYIENGKRGIGIPLLDRIARALDVSLSAFFEDEITPRQRELLTFLSEQGIESKENMQAFLKGFEDLGQGLDLQILKTAIDLVEAMKKKWGHASQ